MEAFTTISTPYSTLPVNDIDTDQIIPARFLKVTDKAGLGDNLFYDWRYDENGNPKADFILNRPEAKKAAVLVAGNNFGCGSSREHAPWALKGFGFRAVISTAFADIFRNNAYKNNLLPIVLRQEEIQILLDAEPGAVITIDLAAQHVVLPDGSKAAFAIDAFNKACLLEGIDQLGYLLKHRAQIETYEAGHPPRINTLL